jgi:hypothetical protein
MEAITSKGTEEELLIDERGFIQREDRISQIWNSFFSDTSRMHARLLEYQIYRLLVYGIENVYPFSSRQVAAINRCFIEKDEERSRDILAASSFPPDSSALGRIKERLQITYLKFAVSYGGNKHFQYQLAKKLKNYSSASPRDDHLAIVHFESYIHSTKNGCLINFMMRFKTYAKANNWEAITAMMHEANGDSEKMEILLMLMKPSSIARLFSLDSSNALRYPNWIKMLTPFQFYTLITEKPNYRNCEILRFAFKNITKEQEEYILKHWRDLSIVEPRGAQYHRIFTLLKGIERQDLFLSIQSEMLSALIKGLRGHWRGEEQDSCSPDTSLFKTYCMSLSEESPDEAGQILDCVQYSVINSTSHPGRVRMFDEVFRLPLLQHHQRMYAREPGPRNGWTKNNHLVELTKYCLKTCQGLFTYLDTSEFDVLAKSSRLRTDLEREGVVDDIHSLLHEVDDANLASTFRECRSSMLYLEQEKLKKRFLHALKTEEFTPAKTLLRYALCIGRSDFKDLMKEMWKEDPSHAKKLSRTLLEITSEDAKTMRIHKILVRAASRSQLKQWMDEGLGIVILNALIALWKVNKDRDTGLIKIYTTIFYPEHLKLINSLSSSDDPDTKQFQREIYQAIRNFKHGSLAGV